MWTLPLSAANEEPPEREVAKAYERLHAQPHRKRESVDGPMAAVAGMKPMVTDVDGERTRQFVEMDVPQVGLIRTERITVGERAAYRMHAPGISSMLAQTRKRITVSTARSLLQQAISVLTAIQTGGLSTQSAISNLLTAATTLKTTADAKRALDQAEAAFNQWVLVQEDDEEDDLSEFDGADDQLVEYLGEEKHAGRALRKFRRRPPFDIGMAVEDHVYIDAANGLPVAEEAFMGGQRMMRVEYFDVGATLTIELPAVLAP